MITFLLAHIGVPLIAGIALIVFESASSRNPLSWDDGNEIGLDFTLLSIGATGAIFVNERLLRNWGENTPLYGILVVLVNMILAAWLLTRRRWREHPATAWQAFTDMFLGVLALSITCGVFAVGYS